MRTKTILAIVIALAIMAVPVAAQAAMLRVTSAAQPFLGNLEWNVGSTQSYSDVDGNAYPLAANTALGQLVAGTAFTSTPLRVQEFAGLGPYVAKIGRVKVPATGSWMLFVNSKAAQTGALSVILKKSDRVLWVLDLNYAKKGPFVLNMNAITLANGDIRAKVTRIGGTKPTAAAGAGIYIDGKKVATTNKQGFVRFAPSGTDWNVLQAKMTGSISSQLLPN